MTDPPTASPRSADATGVATPAATLSPAGPAWHALLEARRAPTHRGVQVSELSRRFRAELGLPTDRPVVMSGHQAQWWHAGILAKHIALVEFCRREDAAPAWVVVDQDASQSASITYPGAPRNGALPEKSVWHVAPASLADHLRADVALADLAAFSPAQAPDDAATPDVSRGLRAIADSAARWAHAGSAAEQIARANAELAGAALGDATNPRLLFATALLRTGAARSLLERMADDPRACVEAYNHAIAETGAPSMAPLSCVPEKNRYELPLWGLSARGGPPTPRRRIFAATLGDVPLHALAPRAVLMTALLRWLGCDLFIHGTGGGASGEQGGYDKVAEAWFRRWLDADLAPSVVATATLHLPVGVTPTLSESDLRAAHRRIEDARHAPRTTGDHAAQAEKDALVAAIAAAPGRAERSALYRRMQRALEAYRAAHAGDLRSASAAAEGAATELARQAVLRDRTWPWPLLPRTMVLELRRLIGAALEPSRG